MIRKTLYALIAISFVIVINQITGNQGTVPTPPATTAPTSTSPNIAAGTVEVRILSSSIAPEVTSANVTISSVEIHTNDGWTPMTLDKNSTIDLKQAEGLEKTVATTSNLNQGTYTTVRLSISSVEVTLGSGQPQKAKLSASRLTFSQNFQVTAKNTTVLVFNFDSDKAIDYSVKTQIKFLPFVSLLYTRTPGSMDLVYAALPQGGAGVAYSTQLLAIGGQAPYSWSIIMGDLPPGLQLNPDTGAISGIPTTAGNFNFMVRADDSSPNRKNTTRNYTVGIAAGGVLQIATGRLPDAAEKVAYKATLQAFGSVAPYTWSVTGNLPAGLTIDPKSGIISGTPTLKGDYSIVVYVTDSAAPSTSDTQTVNIHIAPEVVLG